MFHHSSRQANQDRIIQDLESAELWTGESFESGAKEPEFAALNHVIRVIKLGGGQRCVCACVEYIGYMDFLYMMYLNIFMIPVNLSNEYIPIKKPSIYFVGKCDGIIS